MDYARIKGTSIKLVSSSGQTIRHISNTNLAGSGLECKVSFKKNGGLDKIDFSVYRRTSIPTFPGMIVEVYKDNYLFATGYSDTIPKPGSDENLLEINCLGYLHKLKEETVDKVYNDVTLVDILDDVSPIFEGLDISYNVANIELPNISIFSIEFKNKDVLSVITTILQIANHDYNNAEYRWFIDEQRMLHFEEIIRDSERGLFEGFNYQSPKILVADDNITNRVLAYKSSTTSQGELVYMGTYNDTESQGKYGVKSRKLVFPTTVDLDTLELMVNSVIEKDKEPKTKIKIGNLQGIDYPFKFYNISNRIDEYWKLLSECDSFNDWDLSLAVASIITLSSEKVLTGRQSIKCDIQGGSLNEEIILTPPAPIFAPSLFRMYMYLEEAFNFDIIVKSVSGVETLFDLGTTDLKLEAGTAGGVKNVETYTGSSLKNLGITIQISYVGQWLKFEVPLTTRSIESVSIRFKSDADTTGYIDRIEVLSKSYDTHKLTLEKIDYVLDKDFALSTAEFGREFPSLADAISDKVSDGQIMLSQAAAGINESDVYLGPTRRKIYEKTMTGIIIPLYVYPGNIVTNSTYNDLIALAKSNKSIPIVVILNPANGPGTVVDGNYATAIKSLKGAGITVLGYISTDYTARDIELVIIDIYNWEYLYPEVEGVFFDEMTYLSTPENLAYYKEVNIRAKATTLFITVANPGSPFSGDYYEEEASDVIVGWESGSYPTLIQAKEDWLGGAADYDFNRRAALVHSQATYDTGEATQLSTYYGWIYITDDLLSPNPWDTLSNYMSELITTAKES
jgi:hypothetical protein